MDQILINSQIKPQIGVDTIYLTFINLTYLKELSINPLIPTKKQNRQNLGNLPDNHFTIN